MRTNIEIDDELMAEVLRETGLRTKRAAVDEGLRLLLERSRRRRAAEMFGKLPKWEGDLDALRGRAVAGRKEGSSSTAQSGSTTLTAERHPTRTSSGG